MKPLCYSMVICLLASGCARNAPLGRSDSIVPDPGQNARVRLVFVIDQGWGNGPINKGDVDGMRRTLDALKPLQARYDVSPLFATHVSNRDNLDALLDLCVEEGFTFFFDVISSDGMTIAGAPQTNPYDETHGQEISVEELAQYKARYGDWLAGIRFMEIFGQDFMVERFDQYPEWQHEGYSGMPDTSIPFFDPAIIRPYLALARDTGMAVQWSEFHWARNPEEDPGHQDRIDVLSKLLGEFPGLVTITYANNQPEYASLKRLGDWTQDVRPMLAMGAKDLGLSNQSWIYNLDPMNCPPELIIQWAASALDDHGLRYMQFEPGFYFFHYPVGILRDDGSDYTTDPQWADRGGARMPLEEVFEFLLSR
jgi:hypothetical protein